MIERQPPARTDGVEPDTAPLAEAVEPDTAPLAELVEPETAALTAGDFAAVRGKLESTLFEIKRVIVGQERMLERVLVALLSGGHVLIEGVPGLAKTLTVKTLAEVLGGSFRIGRASCRERVGVSGG